MKKSILSLAIALITLFSVTAATAQNCHWISGPCLSGNVITGKIAGLGHGDITIKVYGQFSCTNPAQHDPNPWQDFLKTKTDQVAKNGNYNLNYDLKLCNNRWTLTYQNVNIEIWQGGVKVLEADNVQTCQ